MTDRSFCSESYFELVHSAEELRQMKLRIFWCIGNINEEGPYEGTRIKGAG